MKIKESYNKQKKFFEGWYFKHQYNNKSIVLFYEDEKVLFDLESNNTSFEYVE